MTTPTPKVITASPPTFLLRHGRSLLLIVLIALNLRPAVTGVAPLLGDIREDLGLSSAAAGALTTLPVLCFGFFGLIAPALTRRVREEVLLAGSMALLIVGIFVRIGPWQLTLFAGALLVGLAISVGNVAAPALFKRDQPESVTFVTAVYTTAVTLGAAASSGIMVPIQEVADSGWRLPLGVLAAPALIAGLAWLPRARRAARKPIAQGTTAASLWRDRLAWQITAFMGLQSLLAYVVFAWLPTLCQDRGLSQGSAGLVLAVSCLVQATGSLLVPAIDRHLRDQRPLVLAVVAFTAVGLAGVAWAPVGLIWLNAVVLGLGQGAGFALALAFIGLRSGDARVAARLSGMAQGVGYLIAAVGPFAVGLLHDVSNGWTVPIAILIAIALLEGLPGMMAGRARTIRAATPATVVE
ncbi:MFS transporter [Actinomadura sp. HBU206391]|uniref:CynX/NimT family MFS transporter n=1 Tax=Actinomadura sp. HBU206391 TaxID=2731692 RepID=UPI002905E1DC|nr:MFS transporter [Actinomadura sp. HBU206391]